MRDITQPHGELVAIKFIPRGDKVIAWSIQPIGDRLTMPIIAPPPPQIDKNVEREIINHRSLLHPNIIRFREVRGWTIPCVEHLVTTRGAQVFLTPTHLGIAMEYAAGGELFDRIVKAGRFSEDEARYFFQQLISGVDYCHSEVRTSPLFLDAHWVTHP